MAYEVRVSVRNLVEFILRNGDIDQKSGILQDVDAMQAGSRAHRKLQKQSGSNYKAEVSLKRHIILEDDVSILVEGRADGIIEPLSEDQLWTIDEIKGTYKHLETIEDGDLLHWAQADCYACIFAKQHSMEHIKVRITYIHLETEEIKVFEKERNIKELEQWFKELVWQYGKWAKWQRDWKSIRNESINRTSFPYTYRESQKRMMNGVYRAIQEKKNIFIQAPTGTGKTLGTLFPTIKLMGVEQCEKIFYLTAKTIARTVAESSAHILGKNGLRMKFITLTAKEKICPLDECICQPEVCSRAKGHFDRVNDAIFEIIENEDLMDRECIERYALKYQVCPFEFQLDVSLWCDTIICDYNYVFDPVVYLKRFFADPMLNMVYLVDEAHNLVERARDMYSARLDQQEFQQIYRLLKVNHGKIAKKVHKCGQYFKDFLEKRMESGGSYCVIDEIGSFILSLMRLVSALEDFLKEEMAQEQREKVKTLYFNARRFINTYDLMDDKYVVYTEGEQGDVIIRLFCIDPSENLYERIQMGRSCVFFSATLLPVQYYKDLLSKKNESDYEMYVDSPFDSKNRLIFTVNDVSSRFSLRNEAQYKLIAEYILKIIRCKNGNYLVFCPSYTFMENVFNAFADLEMKKAGNGLKVFCQESNMNEEARHTFLSHFKENPHETTLGFCVLGGIFSEGIDLKADRLIGAIIVGTGLPGIGSEREIIRSYFDEKKGYGFNYAYLYPGMNKVLQAGGRVIRSEEDKGVIALLDERFNYGSYHRLFPREWIPFEKLRKDNVGAVVEHFWT